MENNKHLILLEFKRDSILYDLKNLGYIIADSSQKQTPDDKHNLTDIGEDGNIDRVARQIDLAFANVIRFLSGYVEKTVDEDTFGHNVLLEPENYEIMISVNTNTPGSTIGVLRTYIHEYVVSFVMEDWTSIVSPEHEPIWARKMENLETDIKGCLAYQKKGVRVKPHPFP